MDGEVAVERKGNRHTGASQTIRITISNNNNNHVNRNDNNNNDTVITTIMPVYRISSARSSTDVGGNNIASNH